MPKLKAAAAAWRQNIHVWRINGYGGSGSVSKAAWRGSETAYGGEKLTLWRNIGNGINGGGISIIKRHHQYRQKISGVWRAHIWRNKAA